MRLSISVVPSASVHVTERKCPLTTTSAILAITSMLVIAGVALRAGNDMSPDPKSKLEYFLMIEIKVATSASVPRLFSRSLYRKWCSERTRNSETFLFETRENETAVSTFRLNA